MVKPEMNIKQIKQAFQNLPADQRIKLIEEFERDTWEIRFKKIFARIDARRKKSPISSHEVNRLIEDARQDYYARHRR